MKDYKVEIVNIHIENPYIKVYLNISDDMEQVRIHLEMLPLVNHCNITDNQAETRKSLVVYPMKTYSIEDVKTEVEWALARYFEK